MEESNISYYTDISKQNEFLEQLKSIVNREDSSIKECTISFAVSNQICLFLESFLNKPSSSLTFNFSQPLDTRRAITGGFSQSDLDDLQALCDKFTFSNRYEGQFFASIFFLNPFSNKRIHTFIVKYTPDANDNKYLINDSMFVSKYFSILEKEDIDYLFKYLNESDISSGLLNVNFNGFRNYVSKDEVTSIIMDNNSSGFYLVEHYKEFETSEVFIKSISKLVDSKLVEIDLRQFLKK